MLNHLEVTKSTKTHNDRLYVVNLCVLRALVVKKLLSHSCS